MTSIVEGLYERVRQDIVECSLTPGKSFSETELGRHYTTSRTPVREVCRRLEREGLIRITPYRGYMIAPLSVSEFHDLEEMQLIFEPEAAALAAERATDAELARIAGLAAYEYRSNDQASYREFIRTNYDLHCLIAQSTRNRRLFDVVGNVHVRLMRFFFLGLPFDSYGPALVAEHLAMADALSRRDAEEARSQAASHIRKAMERSATLLMSAIRFGETVFEATHLEGSIQAVRPRERQS